MIKKRIEHHNLLFWKSLIKLYSSICQMNTNMILLYIMAQIPIFPSDKSLCLWAITDTDLMVTHNALWRGWKSALHNWRKVVFFWLHFYFCLAHHVVCSTIISLSLISLLSVSLTEWQTPAAVISFVQLSCLGFNDAFQWTQVNPKGHFIRAKEWVNALLYSKYCKGEKSSQFKEFKKSAFKSVIL